MANEPTRILIRLDGTPEAMEAATKKAGQILEGLRKAGQQVARLVIADIRANFGAPGMLQRRSGWLSNSLASRTAKKPAGVKVSIGIRKDIPYGPIFEFGGKTKPHPIRPLRKRALRWSGAAAGDVAPGVLNMRRARSARQGTADQAFAEAVMHPGAKYEPRPFLRPGVIRNRDLIVEMFNDAVIKAVES